MQGIQSQSGGEQATIIILYVLEYSSLSQLTISAAVIIMEE